MTTTEPAWARIAQQFAEARARLAHYPAGHEHDQKAHGGGGSGGAVDAGLTRLGSGPWAGVMTRDIGYDEPVDMGNGLVMPASEDSDRRTEAKALRDAIRQAPVHDGPLYIPRNKNFLTAGTQRVQEVSPEALNTTLNYAPDGSLEGVPVQRRVVLKETKDPALARPQDIRYPGGFVVATDTPEAALKAARTPPKQRVSEPWILTRDGNPHALRVDGARAIPMGNGRFALFLGDGPRGQEELIPGADVIVTKATTKSWTEAELDAHLGHYPGGREHDQSRHSGGKALLSRRVEDTGGYTARPEGRAMVEPHEGISVATQGHSRSFDPELWAQDPAGHIAQYMSDKADVLASNPRYNLGGWKAPDGTVWLDVSEVFADREEGIRAGRERGEQAVFDLKTHEEIPTGGTGDTSDHRSAGATAEPEARRAGSAEGLRPGDPGRLRPGLRGDAGRFDPADVAALLTRVASPQSDIERFNSMWEKGEGDDPCHNWTGEKNPKGYGQFWCDGSAQLAHKWIYEHHHGSIGKKTVDHKCQNTSCVRLGHLQAMSREKNTSLETTRKQGAFLTIEEARQLGLEALRRGAVAAAPDHSDGCMVALMLSPEAAEACCVEGGLPVEEMHVTLLYLGDVENVDRDAVLAAMESFRSPIPGPLVGHVGGALQFDADDEVPHCATVDVPGLAEFRTHLVEHLQRCGIENASEHGWTAHVTRTYLPKDQPGPDPLPNVPVRFDAVQYVHGAEVHDFPIGAIGSGHVAHYPGGHEHDQGKHRGGKGGGGEVLTIPGEAGHTGTGGVPLWENLPEKDQRRAVAKLEGMVTDEDGNPLGIDEIRRRVVENEVALVLDATTKERDWYFEHHAILSDIAGRYGVDVGQCAGAMAALSSNKRVSENLAQVEKVAKALHEHETVEVTAAGLKEYNAWAKKRKTGDIKPHPELKPGTYLVRAQPGSDMEVLPADVLVSSAGLGGKGIPKTRPTELALKATKILRGDATADEVISGPKHRSFVNNLTDPNGDRDVTHDTWDYRAKFTGMKIRREVTVHEPLYGPDGHVVKEGKNAVWVPKRDKDGKPIKETVTASVEDLQHPRYGVTPQDIFQGNNTPRKDGTINYGTYPLLTHIDRQVARDPRVVKASGGRPLVGSQVQAAVWGRQKVKADAVGRRDFAIPETGTPNPEEYAKWLKTQP